MHNHFKKIALRAVKESGKLLIGEYNRFDRHDIKLKSRHEILTKADLLSEEIIIKELRANFPAHGIVSEESGKTGGKSDYVWYIDPVDGTTNFSMHNPLWSISLALAFEGEIVLGIIYAPLLEELYLAVKEEGTELNNKTITVSDISGDKALNTFCHGGELPDIKRALKYYRTQKLTEFDCRQLGSAAIELAFVAAGRTESFVAPGSNDWDVAAGALIVREAGGRVTDFLGREWRLGSRDILASNGKMHNQLLKVLGGK